MSKTDKEKRALIEHLRTLPIVQAACKKAGVGRATYYRWRTNDPEFAEQADEAIQQGVLLVNDLAESQLIDAIRNQNMGAIGFWLRNRHPDYEQRVKVKATIKQERNELTEEQRHLVEKALRMGHLLDIATEETQDITEGEDDEPKTT